MCPDDDGGGGGGGGGVGKIINLTRVGISGPTELARAKVLNEKQICTTGGGVGLMKHRRTA